MFASRFPKAYDLLMSNGNVVTIIDSVRNLRSTDKKLLNMAQGLVPAAETIDSDLLSEMPNLQIISKMGSGMDNIDLDYCRTHGIVVTNSKGENAEAVAEMTLALMLASLRKLVYFYQCAQNGEWHKRIPGEELQGKTVGLVGYGFISRRVAKLLSSFETNTIAFDPYLDEKTISDTKVVPVTFKELLKTSDIISLHLPATPETKGLFNDSVFTSMKKGCCFINCSRGSIVDETALYQALFSKHLACAACDVFQSEPLSPANKLFTLDNFIGTPHVAGMTTQSAEKDSMAIAMDITAFFSGAKPLHQVP